MKPKIRTLTSREWLEANLAESVSIPELLKYLESHRKPDVQQKPGICLKAQYIQWDMEKCGDEDKTIGLGSYWLAPVFRDEMYSLAKVPGIPGLAKEIQINSLSEGEFRLVTLFCPDGRLVFETMGDHLLVDYDEIECLIRMLKEINLLQYNAKTKKK